MEMFYQTVPSCRALARTDVDEHGGHCGLPRRSPGLRAPCAAAAAARGLGRRRRRADIVVPLVLRLLLFHGRAKVVLGVLLRRLLVLAVILNSHCELAL